MLQSLWHNMTKEKLAQFTKLTNQPLNLSAYYLVANRQKHGTEY